MDLSLALKPLDPASITYKLFAGVFGQGWESFLTNGAVTGPSGGLFSLLGGLNDVSLIMVTCLSLYVMGRGAIGTANDGTAMGRTLSTFWTPIRMAGSVALLTPIKGGLSALQVLMLASIAISNQGANAFATFAVDQMLKTHGSSIVSAPGHVRAEGEEIAAKLFQGLVIQEFFQVNDEVGNNGLMLAVDKTGKEFTIYLTSPRVTNGPDDLGRDGSMGAVTITCSTDIGRAAAQAQVTAIQAMVSTLRPAAHDLVSVYDPEGKAADPAVLTKAVDTYVNSLGAVQAEVLSRLGAEEQQQIQRFAEEVKKQGWIVLGSYFWTVTQIQHKLTEAAYPSVSSTAPKWGQYAQYTSAKIYFSPYQAAVQHFIDLANAEVYNAVVVQEADSSLLGKIKMMLANSNSWSARKLCDSLSDGDPIYTLQNIGSWIVSITGGILLMLCVGTAAATLIGAAGGFATGGPLGALGGGTTAALVASGGGMLGAICLPLFLLGIMLAYYIPIIPGLYYLVAVVSYVILCVEALIAAPVWCVAHALPADNEEGFLTGHSRQGYMLLTNLMCRPLLTVVAFFAIFSMLGGLSMVIGYLTKILVGGVMAADANADLGGPGPSLLRNFVGMLLVSVIMGVVIHKVFQMVIQVPDRVIRWVGGAAEQMGEHEAESKVRGAVLMTNRTVGTASGAAQNALQRGQSAARGGANQEGLSNLANALQPGHTGDRGGGRPSENDKSW